MSEKPEINVTINNMTKSELLGLFKSIDILTKEDGRYNIQLNITRQEKR